MKYYKLSSASYIMSATFRNVIRLPKDYINDAFNMADDEIVFGLYNTYLSFRNARKGILDNRE